MTYAHRFAKAYQEQLLECAGYDAGYQRHELAKTPRIPAITRIWRQFAPSDGLKGTKVSLEAKPCLSQDMP